MLPGHFVLNACPQSAGSFLLLGFYDAHTAPFLMFGRGLVFGFFPLPALSLNCLSLLLVFVFFSSLAPC